MTTDLAGPCGSDSSAVLGVIPREEWQRRYAARIMERAGWPEHAAIEAARVGAEEYERNERAAGNAVVWLGVSAGGPWDTPEDLADEEMSYWDDDGEG
jgi:hypothetical protein